MGTRAFERRQQPNDGPAVANIAGAVLKGETAMKRLNNKISGPDLVSAWTCAPAPFLFAARGIDKTGCSAKSGMAPDNQ